MRRNFRCATRRNIVMLAALALAFAACAPAYYVEVENDPVVSNAEPPDDLDETPPPAPSAQAVWARGYWYWTGVRYVWVAGSWYQPPEAGFVWVHPGWVFINTVWRFMPGRWAHPHRVPRYPYYRHPHSPRPRHH